MNMDYALALNRLIWLPNLSRLMHRRRQRRRRLFSSSNLVDNDEYKQTKFRQLFSFSCLIGSDSIRFGFRKKSFRIKLDKDLMEERLIMLISQPYATRATCNGTFGRWLPAANRVPFPSLASKLILLAFWKQSTTNDVLCVARFKVSQPASQITYIR